MSYLRDLIRDWLCIFWQVSAPYVFLATLCICLITSNPWIYHSLLIVTFVAPSLLLLRKAYRPTNTQDPPPQHKYYSLTAAAILLIIYFTCLYFRVS